MSRDASPGQYLPNIQRKAKRRCKGKKKFYYSNVFFEKNLVFPQNRYTIAQNEEWKSHKSDKSHKR